MKRVLIIAAVVCAFCLFATMNASAEKANGKKAKLIAKYDKNGNGVIDGEVKDALRKDLAANPNGELKAYDTDGDGKLSDEEIASIKPGSGKAKSGDKAKAKSKKKADVAEPEKAKDEKKTESTEKKAD